jgi:hypothetical protein
MAESDLREILLDVIESSLDAQLRAVRRLRKQPVEPLSRSPGRPKKSMSHLDMAYDILSSGPPLHIHDLLAAIKERFDLDVDRESLVSALSKRVARGDRFVRTARNTFALRPPL